MRWHWQFKETLDWQDDYISEQKKCVEKHAVQKSGYGIDLHSEATWCVRSSDVSEAQIGKESWHSRILATTSASYIYSQMINTKYIYSQMINTKYIYSQMININSQMRNLRWIWFDAYHMTTFAFAEVEFKKELIGNILLNQTSIRAIQLWI